MYKEGVSRMLHVIDNYYAKTNNYGYSVLRDTGKQNPKTVSRHISPLDMLGQSKRHLSWLRRILYITT